MHTLRVDLHNFVRFHKVNCDRCAVWCGVWPSWKLSEIRRRILEVKSGEEEAMSDDEVKDVGT